MTKQTIIKLQLQVGADHTIRLPDEVPIGPAEMIVLPRMVESEAPPEARGLFKDSPEPVDQAMAHIAEMRSRSRIRPAK
jgi:hypothetical protein